MAQRAINMHTSQISHGRFDLDTDHDNPVTVGYTPSMIRLMLLSYTGGGDPNAPIARCYWYSTDKEHMFVTVSSTIIGDSVEDSIITVTERGFILDGTAEILTSRGNLGVDTVEVVWETFGSDPGKGTTTVIFNVELDGSPVAGALVILGDDLYGFTNSSGNVVFEVGAGLYNYTVNYTDGDDDYRTSGTVTVGNETVRVHVGFESEVYPE